MTCFTSGIADRAERRNQRGSPKRAGEGFQPSLGMPAGAGEQRLSGIDFLRVLSMLSVMMVHVTSTYLDYESSVHFLGMNLAFFLNQTTRFCVPMFFLLSGFSLGIRQKRESYFAFLKKRGLRVLLPYVVWTLLYEWSNVSFDLRAWMIQLKDLPWLFREILTGQAAPHLYFIPILFQFYLLYPLLNKWVRRRPLQSLAWTLVVTCLVQGGYMLQNFGLLPQSQWPYLWMTFPFWCVYFVAGLCLQKIDFPGLCALCQKNVGMLLCLTVPAACLYSALSLYTGVLNAMKPGLILITGLVFLCGIGVWENLRRVRFLRSAVLFLSAHSKGIYYNHVMGLCFLRQFSRFQLGMSGMLLLFLATLCLAVLVDLVLGLAWRIVRRGSSAGGR